VKITATVEGIQYQTFLQNSLNCFGIEIFDINTVPGSCVVRIGTNEFGLSKWISPKRTRSYPYARVYDTIAKNKRVTVIPIVKDEGLNGDRDFIQWDTISLMSLLEVYVIFGYYNQAIKNPKRANKITKQKFDNHLVVEKLRELSNYQSSALHWNLKELRETLPGLVDRQVEAYTRIQKRTGVQLKSASAYEVFKKELEKDISVFMESSRRKAEQAQAREVLTSHAREYLETITKASITISNYIGGKYFFTVDEVAIQNDRISLIESKHTNGMLIPSVGDIKDGLLKMILYSNLSNVVKDKERFSCQPILKLTSSRVLGNITSQASQEEVREFLNLNHFSAVRSALIHTLFTEANHNKFILQISQKL
jgi:hypothetical protein